jgi:hypothetical protein
VYFVTVGKTEGEVSCMTEEVRTKSNRMDLSCEALEVYYCITFVPDENKFEARLKEELPLGAKYLMRWESCSTYPAGGLVSWCTVLVWLGEAQLDKDVTEWLSKVVGSSSGNDSEELLSHMRFPTSNQTGEEFVVEKLYGYMIAYVAGIGPNSSCRSWRGNLGYDDISCVKREMACPFSDDAGLKWTLGEWLILLGVVGSGVQRSDGGRRSPVWSEAKGMVTEE